MTSWTLVSAASQQRIKPLDQGIVQLDWTLGLIRLGFTSSGPYETTCIERRCCRCYRICIWKISTTNNEEERWKKNKREDERQKENFLFGVFLLPCRIWGHQICWSQTDCRQSLPFLPQNNHRVVVVVVAQRNDRERRERRTNHQSVGQWKKRSAKP